MIEDRPRCAYCAQSYDGADDVLRCRITGRAAVVPCTSFEREAGSDDDLDAGMFCDDPGRAE